MVSANFYCIKTRLQICSRTIFSVILLYFLKLHFFDFDLNIEVEDLLPVLEGLTKICISAEEKAYWK